MADGRVVHLVAGAVRVAVGGQIETRVGWKDPLEEFQAEEQQLLTCPHAPWKPSRDSTGRRKQFDLQRYKRLEESLIDYFALD